ncbi:MAG TPA: pyridoxamine 5'-phosphate oxidase family protein [Candidatus Desulfobacillus sp.]|nr:pyridoxamine 5'-phosphate oxidase family protein [Candidatus Desulfobacillus sp.]
MIGNITPRLPEKLVAYLRPGAPGLLLTAGADGYATSAYTWMIALDDQRARFAVDEGGSTMANLQRSGQASLQVIGQGDISFIIKGRARQLKPKLDAAAPYVIQLWEMEVAGAKDQSWPGVSTSALSYEWPAGQREAMLAMEQAVYKEMKGA